MKNRKPDGRKSRTPDSYAREPGNRIPGGCVLIVCEGEETEPKYFEGLKWYLKLSTVQVKVTNTKGGSPTTIIEKAYELNVKRKQEIRGHRTRDPEFDDVWCVFDVENLKDNPTFHQAVRVADENRFKLAISNPAFEFWYVLHFEPTNRPFSNGTELKGYMDRHIRGYQPAKDVFPQLVKRTSTAISNAEKLLANRLTEKDRFPNPSTHVHDLVKALCEMSQIGSSLFPKC